MDKICNLSDGKYELVELRRASAEMTNRICDHFHVSLVLVMCSCFQGSTFISCELILKVLYCPNRKLHKNNFSSLSSIRFLMFSVV